MFATHLELKTFYFLEDISLKIIVKPYVVDHGWSKMTIIEYFNSLNNNKKRNISIEYG